MKLLSLIPLHKETCNAFQCIDLFKISALSVTVHQFFGILHWMEFGMSL